jgi:hypothetical protein
MADKKKWTSDSAANRLLINMFMDEKITSSDLPKDIYNKYPQFQEYPANTFRAHFYTCKSKFLRESKYLKYVLLLM